MPFACAILFSLFAVPAVTHAATAKKPPAHGKQAAASAPAPAEPEDLSPLCGLVGNKTLSIPPEYVAAGAIFDADKPGDGCGKAMIIAGAFISLKDMSPAQDVDMSEPDSGYLIVGSLSRPYELGAKKAIEEDIIQRSMAEYAHQQVYPSMVSRTYGKISDAHYWGHEYFYNRDAAGNMIPWKICKTYRRGDPDAEVCELIYSDKQLGLSFRIGLKPNVVVDYEYMRQQALQVISKLIVKA